MIFIWKAECAKNGAKAVLLDTLFRINTAYSFRSYALSLYIGECSLQKREITSCFLGLPTTTHFERLQPSNNRFRNTKHPSCHLYFSEEDMLRPIAILVARRVAQLSCISADLCSFRQYLGEYAVYHCTDMSHQRKSRHFIALHPSFISTQSPRKYKHSILDKGIIAYSMLSFFLHTTFTVHQFFQISTNYTTISNKATIQKECRHHETKRQIQKLK